MGLDIYWGRIDPKGAQSRSFRSTELAQRQNKYSHAALLVKMAQKLGAVTTTRRTFHTWDDEKDKWVNPKREPLLRLSYRRASNVNTGYDDGWIEGSAVNYSDLYAFYRDPERHARNEDNHIDYANIYLTKKSDIVKLAGFIGEGAKRGDYKLRVAKALLKDFIEGQDFVLLNW